MSYKNNQYSETETLTKLHKNYYLLKERMRWYTPYGVPGKQTIFYRDAEEIKTLLDRINKIDDLTSSFQFGRENQVLRESDLQYLSLIEEVSDKIIALANVSQQNDIPLINRTYFKGYGYNIKDDLDMFLESFNFYKMIDNSINHSLIKYAEKISKRFRMGKKDTIKYKTYIADAYYEIGEEEIAVGIINSLIDSFPTYDEPYQVLLNWCMYKDINIKNIENVVRKANMNKHRLVSGDFAYNKLIEYYKNKDDKKYMYYTNFLCNFLNGSIIILHKKIYFALNKSFQ